MFQDQQLLPFPKKPNIWHLNLLLPLLVEIFDDILLARFSKLWCSLLLDMSEDFPERSEVLDGTIDTVYNTITISLLSVIKITTNIQSDQSLQLVYSMARPAYLLGNTSNLVRCDEAVYCWLLNFIILMLTINRQIQIQSWADNIL
jgi:hypothetical protein